MRRTALKRAAGYLLVALLPGLLGCSDDDPGEETCDGSPPTRGAIAGALSLGEGGPDDFRPYVEDRPAELVLGLQGGYMLLPELRADAAAFSEGSECAKVALAAEVDAVDVPPLVVSVAPLSAENGYFHVGPLPLFLSDNRAELEGKMCRIGAVFRYGDTQATAQVSVLLVDADASR